MSMSKYKKEVIIFKTREVEIIKIEDIRSDLKHLNSYIFKNPITQKSVFIHYNYVNHILKLLNESKKTS